jgi:hypothetical protein
MAYQFRARDRRLMEQAERDVALTLQRDYFLFNCLATGKKTTELSSREPVYSGYLTTGVNVYPNISWTSGSEVDAAFATLQQLLTQLSKGYYQKPSTPGGKNRGIWPVQSINWAWIQSLYAYINPAYAAWLVTNNITVPSWSTEP